MIVRVLNNKGNYIVFLLLCLQIKERRGKEIRKSREVYEIRGYSIRVIIINKCYQKIKVWKVKLYLIFLKIDIFIQFLKLI